MLTVSVIVKLTEESFTGTEWSISAPELMGQWFSFWIDPGDLLIRSIVSHIQED